MSFQAEEAYKFVLRHISQGSIYEGVYRKDRWEYPVIAIREAIRNAVIHRDYSLSGKDIKIAIFDDKIEITSPGKLMPTIDFDDMESGQSDIRNKVLASVFKKLGIIEQWGNGLRLIAEELRKYPEIKFEWSEPGISFRITFRKINYNPEIQKGEDIQTATDYDRLSVEEKKVLLFLLDNEKISKKEAMNLINAKETKTKEVLKSLVEKNLIQRQGKGRSTYYVLKIKKEKVMSDKLLKGWKKVKLGEICEDISYGYTASAKSNPVGPKFLRITDIVPERINWDEVPYCEIDEKKAKKYKLEVGDIVVARTGATTGYNKIIKNNINSVFASYLIRYRINKEFVDPFFVWYNLQSPNWYGFVDNIIGGSAQPGANAKQFADFEFFLPTLPEQKAIASVLSSLDDKIDLLHRQNQTLEQMAQTLFRKWFIEDAKDDWEEVSLGDSDLATIISSGIEKFEGEKIYIKTGDVKDTNITGGTKITYESRPSRANMQPIKFSVWFAKKGGVRKLLMFDDYSDTDKYILSTGFSGLKTNELSHYYVWCFVLTKEFQEIKDSFVSGSVQPDITNEGIKNIIVLKPDEQILFKFNEIVKPLFYKYQQNKEQIRTLENLRDTLLPKLMSGEIKLKIRGE
ncbi:MAG: Restriction modification system DNA specificity domain [Desulfonauticus sp. 38_4375]|nr:MAG: Restriction modification system DNA specificity domain [Desulfonauticus sp. 38_4375]